MSPRSALSFVLGLLGLCLAAPGFAQQVYLPAPRHLKTATDAVAPQDILDIFVSEPIRISVKAVQVVTTPAATPKK